MTSYFYRNNHTFLIDKSKLKLEAQSIEICNALYEAVYNEFAGAVYNSNYNKLNSLEKLNKMNIFAENWLKSKGLL